MAEIIIKLIDESSKLEETFKVESNLAKFMNAKSASKEFEISFVDYVLDGNKSFSLINETYGEIIIDASVARRLKDYQTSNPKFKKMVLINKPTLTKIQKFIKGIKNLFTKSKIDGSLLLEPVPEHQEGYCKENNTIIRFVGKKVKEPYQVSGIEDVASKNNWKGWIYLAPIIILISIFSLYPLVNTIFISFTENYKYATGEFSGLTLKNFTYILGLSPNASGGWEVYFTKYALLNTVFLVFITVPISICLALLIAVALNSIKWLKGFLQTIFFLPYVTNAIAIGMVFSVIFDRNGVVNFLLNTDYAWVKGVDAERWRAMIPLCLYIVWNSLPYKILIFLSGLQGIDKQYYQAAQVDAAPKWKVLLKITVPLLSPQILYIMITSFIGAFKEYSSIVGIFNGPGLVNSGGKASDPCMETIVYYVYDNMHSNTSAAAAAAVFLFVIILLFTFFQFKVSKKRVHY